MPRDIRSVIPAFETLYSVAAICIRRTTRQTRRDFGGYGVGKRRKLSVVPYIAQDMAKELLRSVNVSSDGQAAAPGEIAAKIEAILLSVSDEQAFMLAEPAEEGKQNTIDMIADQVRAMVLSDYIVTEIVKEAEPPTTRESNGWKAFETIKSD